MIPPILLAGLLLIDIGDTFGYPVGVTGQIHTAASIVGAIVSVLMGVWSVRYHHKSLLLLGLLFCCISTVGCAFSLNFTMLLLAFSITGIGGAMIDPMTFSLVGKHFPLEQRGRAVGWLFTGGPIAYIIGPPIIGFIAGLAFGGWRGAFLGFVLPVSLLGLTMAKKGVPTPDQSPHPMRSKESVWEGFKKVFANHSAMACLVGTIFSLAGLQAIVFYSISFFRERFLVSIGWAAIILPVMALCYLVGAQVGGRVVNRFGRKPLTILSAVVAGVIIFFFMNVSHLWSSILLAFFGSLCAGMTAATSASLSLEQVPSYRGTMMSLRSAATYIGTALGAGIGGLVLLRLDYEAVGLALGGMYIAAVLIFYFLAIDPTS